MTTKRRKVHTNRDHHRTGPVGSRYRRSVPTHSQVRRRARGAVRGRIARSSVAYVDGPTGRAGSTDGRITLRSRQLRSPRAPLDSTRQAGPRDRTGGRTGHSFSVFRDQSVPARRFHPSVACVGSLTRRPAAPSVAPSVTHARPPAGTDARTKRISPGRASQRAYIPYVA